jgi:ferredoxin
MAVERRLQLDPVACDGFGHCAELLPEFISLDEWGYPIVNAQPVPAHLLAHADRAIRACPRQALRLRRTS